MSDWVGFAVTAALVWGVARFVYRHGFDTVPVVWRAVHTMHRFTWWGIRALLGDRESKYRCLLMIAGRPQSDIVKYLPSEPEPDASADPVDRIVRGLARDANPVVLTGGMTIIPRDAKPEDQAYAAAMADAAATRERLASAYAAATEHCRDCDRESVYVWGSDIPVKDVVDPCEAHRRMLEANRKAYEQEAERAGSILRENRPPEPDHFVRLDRLPAP